MKACSARRPAPLKRCKLEERRHIQPVNEVETNGDALRQTGRTVPEPGVETPLKKALGSKSIPRFFFTDLRFLLEKPKEWPDSRGSFRLDDGVEITGVAEEKTGGDQRRITGVPPLASSVRNHWIR